jgi:hypothetical protein
VRSLWEETKDFRARLEVSQGFGWSTYLFPLVMDEITMYIDRHKERGRPKYVGCSEECYEEGGAANFFTSENSEDRDK